jgi:hypothetical protein
MQRNSLLQTKLGKKSKTFKGKKKEVSTLALSNSCSVKFTMCTYKGVEVQFHAFLYTAVEVSDQLYVAGCFIPGEISPVTIE